MKPGMKLRNNRDHLGQSSRAAGTKEALSWGCLKVMFDEVAIREAPSDMQPPLDDQDGARAEPVMSAEQLRLERGRVYVVTKHNCISTRFEDNCLRSIQLTIIPLNENRREGRRNIIYLGNECS